MKNNKQNDDPEIIVETENEESDNINDEPPSSCETRRKIEDLHELRRYQDELGDFDEVFDLPIAEKV